MLSAAAGIALSPIPIVGVVMMLGTPRGRANGIAFALGWILGITAVCVVVLSLTSGASDPGSSTATGVNWVQVGLGVLFLAMAAKTWRGRPRGAQEPEMPAWLARVDSFGAGKAFGLGILLSALNPKNLALAAAGAASIAEAGLSDAKDAAAIAAFVAVASTSVAGLVAYAVVAPKRSASTLGSVKEFMARHNAAIMMAILLVLGAKLIGDGLGGAL